MTLDYLSEQLPFFYHEGLEVQDVPIRILLSALLGLVIGYNRQLRYHNAGLRTFALITLGSCVAMLCSIFVPEYYGGGDKARIAAQVVSGVGFLGAGAIIRGRGNHIQGITTAALVWVSAVLGLTVGAGMYLSSVLITMIILLILVLLERLKVRIDTAALETSITVTLHGDSVQHQEIKQHLQALGLELRSYSVEAHNNAHLYYISMMVRTPYEREEQTTPLLYEYLSTHPNIAKFKIDA